MPRPIIDPNELTGFINDSDNVGYLVTLRNHINSRLNELGVPAPEARAFTLPEGEAEKTVDAKDAEAKEKVRARADRTAAQVKEDAEAEGETPKPKSDAEPKEAHRAKAGDDEPVKKHK
jgi:hypothetical protein